jgi:hypothetical protein
LASRAFTRTLAALDDSLVRTWLLERDDYWRGSVLVANPRDPSIIDFIVDFLQSSPEDVRELARASVFFEQASWLWSNVTASSSAFSAETRAELEVALQRTYTAVAIAMVTVPVGPNAFSVRRPGTRDFERRLLFLIDIARQSDTLGGWWREAFATRVSRWSRGEGEPESLLKLLAAVNDGDGVDLDAAALAAKQVLITDTSYSYVKSLEWLHQLRSEFPDAFERLEWDQHVSDFETWLRDDLRSSAEDMSDTSELYFIDRVAGLLGVSIEADVWSDAQETVQHDEAERDAKIEPDPDSVDGSTPTRDLAAERREIDAIFIQLAD